VQSGGPVSWRTNARAATDQRANLRMASPACSPSPLPGTEHQKGIADPPPARIILRLRGSATTAAAAAAVSSSSSPSPPPPLAGLPPKQTGGGEAMVYRYDDILFVWAVLDDRRDMKPEPNTKHSRPAPPS
jgi:hypothetical protein